MNPAHAERLAAIHGRPTSSAVLSVGPYIPKGNVVSITAKPHWSNDRETVVSVARHALEAGHLTTVGDLIDFFDEPWHYDEIHESYERECREDRWREDQITLHLDRVAGIA